MCSPSPCKHGEKEKALVCCAEDAVVRAGDFVPKASFLPLAEGKAMC